MSGKPNFIYIGPDKAGSSWLHEVLLRHPQVFLSPAKDLYFFDRYYDRGIAWYLRQFDDAGPEHVVVGEVCQDYLFHPEAPQRIADSLGSCRMMVTLRDPADRAFSSYLYMLRSGWAPGTFLEALERQPMLLEHGSYATALDRFTDRFGRDQIYVAVFDDLVADPQAFIDALTSWLDVDAGDVESCAARGSAAGRSRPVRGAVPVGVLGSEHRARTRRGQPRRMGQAVTARTTCALSTTDDGQADDDRRGAVRRAGRARRRGG